MSINAEVSALPEPIRVSLLTSFRIHAVQRNAAGTLPPDEADLLTFLLLTEPPYQSRRTLIDYFWPDAPTPTAELRLRRTLAALQRHLQPLSPVTTVIVSDRQNVGIAPGSCVVDLLELEALLSSVEVHAHQRLSRCRTCLSRLEAALTTLPTAPLHGLRPGSSPRFTEWYHRRTALLPLRLQQAYRALVEAAMLRGDSVQAADQAHRWTTLLPDDETALRIVMHMAASNGRRRQALQAFEQLRRRREQELSGECGPATLRLAARISNRQVFSAPALHAGAAQPLFGRERERTALDDRLADGVRLNIISGIGGVGKTALALHAARRNSWRATDGVIVLRLDLAADGNDLLRELGRALTLQPDPQQPLLTQISAAIRDHELLIVLDNVEQIDGIDVLLQQIIEQTVRPQLIVTSRRRLQLRDAQMLLLEPLPTTDGTDPAEAGAQLFLQRAGRSADALSTAERSALPVILNLCGGLPLALNIAAALAATRPWPQVVDQLTTTDSAEAAQGDGWPTIAAALRRSWQQLPAATHDLIALIGLFQGDFTVQQLQACAAPIADRALTESTLHALIDQGLLQLGSAGVCTMHPLVRRLLRDEFAARPQLRERVLPAYAEAYLTLLQREGPVIINRAALDWCRAHAYLSEDLFHAWQVAAELRLDDLLLHSAFFFVRFTGIQRLALHFDRLLQQTLAGITTPERRQLRRRLLAAQMLLTTHHQQSELSRAAVEQLLAESDDGPPDAERTIALRTAAEELIERGDFAAARSLIDRSAAYQASADMPFVNGTADIVLAIWHRRRGELESALPLITRALAEARRVGNQRSELAMLNELAMLQVMRGEPAAAVNPLSEAAELARRLDDLSALAVLLTNLGNAREEADGDIDQALREINEGISVATACGAAHAVLVGEAVLARVSHSRGRYRSAYRALHRSLLNDCEHGLRPWTAELLLRYIETLRTLSLPADLAALCRALQTLPPPDGPLAARRDALIAEILAVPPLPPGTPISPAALRALLTTEPAVSDADTPG